MGDQPAELGIPPGHFNCAFLQNQDRDWPLRAWVGYIAPPEAIAAIADALGD
jgi:hypothetical protein